MEHLTLAQTLAADDEPIVWKADAKARLEAQRARLRRLKSWPYPWAPSGSTASAQTSSSVRFRRIANVDSLEPHQFSNL
jgi:hypothetical protein